MISTNLLWSDWAKLSATLHCGLAWACSTPTKFKWEATFIKGLAQSKTWEVDQVWDIQLSVVYKEGREFTLYVGDELFVVVSRGGRGETREYTRSMNHISLKNKPRCYMYVKSPTCKQVVFLTCGKNLWQLIYVHVIRNESYMGWQQARFKFRLPKNYIATKYSTTKIMCSQYSLGFRTLWQQVCVCAHYCTCIFHLQ